MKCSFCGTNINSQYCPNCGKKSDYLPKNYNILLVLFILFLIMVVCGLYLTIYHKAFNYKSYFMVDNNKIYYPIGYKGEAKVENNQNCGYIYDKTNTYVLCFVDSKYRAYKNNDYQYIKEYLNQKEYTILESNEYNNNLLLFKLNSKDENEHYLYVYDFNDKGVITGNYVKKGNVNQKDIKTLQEILEKVNK